jgi:hypothetical protein
VGVLVGIGVLAGVSVGVAVGVGVLVGVAVEVEVGVGVSAGEKLAVIIMLLFMVIEAGLTLIKRLPVQSKKL